MKNEVFNPDDWGMPSASEKGAAAPSPAAAGLSPNNDTIFALVDAVEASGIDITPTYSEWLAIGFALVSELGEEGRQLFHRLSQFNPDYDYKEADRQYNRCLKDGSREITIATLFHIAKSHGIAIGHDSVCSPLPPLREGQGGVPHDIMMRKLRKMRKVRKQEGQPLPASGCQSPTTQHL